MKPNRKKTSTTASCSCCATVPGNSPSKRANSTVVDKKRPQKKQKRSRSANVTPRELTDESLSPEQVEVLPPQELDEGTQNQQAESPQPCSSALPGISVGSDSSSDESESDEDDISFMPNVHNVITQHSQDLLTGNGIQFAEPIGTPIISQVKKSVCKAIWRNKFVDMAHLLPSSHSHQMPTFSLQVVQHSNLTINQTSQSKKITNVESWTTAFLRFMAVYTTKYPAEFQQLLKYTEIVRDIARRRPGLAFLFYDSQFRMLRETSLMPWDRIHTEYWLMACTPLQPTQSFRSTHHPNRSHSPSGPKKFLDKTCWNFNKRTHCQNTKCSQPHICGFCRGSHPAYNCKYSSKEHAAKMQTPTNASFNPKSSK